MILGIDPGLARCGLAELHDNGRIGRVETLMTSKAKHGTQADRLEHLREQLARWVYPAHTVVLERPGFPRGAIAASQLWAVYGLVVGMSCVLGMAGSFRLVVISAREWRKRLGLPSRPASEAKLRKVDTARLMAQRHEGVIAAMNAIVASRREHAYDALAMATLVFEERQHELA